MRNLNFIDRLLTEVDQSLRTTLAAPETTERTYPAADIQERDTLTDEERQLSGRLMRINHAGEVSAQGLYRGQALTAKLPDVREQMERAALEENDHLDWCERRLRELNTNKSLLNPLWYWGSFSIGAAAGLVGDKWSLGFVKETEEQVERHLDKHLAELPAKDLPSMTVLQQMKEDEIRHGEMAAQAGGKTLPWPVRKLVMPMISKAMTASAYRI
ncbi:MAG: 2-polyprenyl-3-methyl-6-methoxy-1,4-benzoquinone monooxygenase [Thiolinea sp.]